MLHAHPAVATVSVTDIDKAKAFYGNVLGLTLAEEMPGVLTYKSGPTQLFVYQSEFAGTNRATAVTWPIDDVPATVKDLKSRGAIFERYPNLPGMTLEGDVHIHGDMKAAWVKDPDGNILALVSG